MFIFPPEVVLPYLEMPDYYGVFLDGWDLIGFMPCSRDERYYSVGTTLGEVRVVPLFLGHDQSGMNPSYGDDHRWCSDTEHATGEWNRDHHWVLYFMGCDNGSQSKRFETREAALDWILNLQEVEYTQILWAKEHGLSWVNS